MKKISLFFLLCFLFSCHPFFMFKPKKFAKFNPNIAANHQNGAEILVDSYGIPHIKAKTAQTAMYALGYMHAKDRLFQLDLIRHAALGRLSELFGERTLSLDKQLRILTYNLEEQVENLLDYDREYILHYVKGVNKAAKEEKRSFEHFLLSSQFEEFTLKDVIAIARLQSWELASDLFAEIFRLRVLESDNPIELKQEFLDVVDVKNSAILPNTKINNIKENWPWPNYIKNNHTYVDVKNMNFGASNAWAVSKDKTFENVAILMNDPHLRHTWPSSFYLASLYTDEFYTAGASFVGLPAILIGSSKHVSWGVTASYVNTQDTVLLNMIDDETYKVEDKLYKLEKWPQKFCINKKQKCFEENFYQTIFGPVLDKNYNKNISDKNKLALMWTGFLVKKHKDFCSNFLNLFKAKNLDEAVIAVKTMTFPGVNIALSDIKGEVGYAYAGLVPIKDRSQHPFLPLDGSKKTSLWQNMLDKNLEPSIKSPDSGYVITANQNIYPKNYDFAYAFGSQGAAPYRAERIKNIIDEKLTKNGKISESELRDIQLDYHSLLAKELTPFLAQNCDLVKNFDGNYHVDSLEALPFEILLKEITKNKLKEIFGQNSKGKEADGLSNIHFLIKNALIKEKNNIKTAIFKGEAKEFIKNSCEIAKNTLYKKYGKNPKNWRFGKHHYLQRQSPLAKAPFFGGLFKDKKREVNGCSLCPMAESGLPVSSGASLRMIAKMTNPPEIKIILDAGNGGFLKEEHSIDQGLLWHEGKMITFPKEFEELKKEDLDYIFLEY